MKKRLFFMVAVLFAVCMLGNGQSVSKAAKKPQVTKIQLSKTQYVLQKGKTVKLKATIQPGKAKRTKVVWKSSKSKLVSVTQKGVIKAKASKGSAVITAKAGKKKASCKITIGQPVQKIQATSFSLEAGKGKKISAKILPKKAAIQKLVYKSSEPSVASVDQKGNVLAKKKGQATITILAADRMKVSKSIQVQVTEKALVNNNKTNNSTDKPSDSADKPSDSTDKPSDSADKPSDSTTDGDDASEDVEKTYGKLSGVVKARQGSLERTALKDAQVHISVGEREMDCLTTASDGTFTSVDLDSSFKYDVTFHKDGFKEVTIEDVEVTPNQTIAIGTEGEIVLLSQSVELVSTDTDIARVSENVITAPNDLTISEIVSVLQNSDGATITPEGTTIVRVVAEDSNVTRNYTLNLVERATLLTQGEDFTIDYSAETLQLSSSLDCEVEYQIDGENTWTKAVKNNAGVFDAISLKNALDQDKDFRIRKVVSDGDFPAAITTLDGRRPEPSGRKFYRIDCQAGLRYGIESGVVGQSYEVYFSKSAVQNFDSIPDSSIHTLKYTGIDAVGTYYETSTYYQYVYVRIPATETTFASEWIASEYSSRDNEFDFDDIP